MPITATRQVVHEIAGEPFRFHVDSRTGQPPYLVDLECFNWNGQCDCTDFRTRKQPYLVKGAVPALHLACYHIHMARLYAMRRLGTLLVEAMEQPESNQKRK